MMMPMVEEAVEAKPAVVRGRLVKTALHQAVLDRRIHQVRLLVSKHHVNVDSKDMYGRTPLMLACLINNQDHGMKMVKIFIKAGAYPNVKDNTGRTALSYACIKGHEDIVKTLLQEDITDVNGSDKDGNSPLMYAVICGKPLITSLLVDKMLQYSMTVDTRNGMGYTPLLTACKFGHYVSGHYLLTVGKASPLLRDNEYFLNAADWLKRGRHLNRRLIQQQSRTLSASFGSYDRDNSTYSSVNVSKSLDNGLSSIDIKPSLINTDEMSIDGQDGRDVLMKLVNEIIDNSGTRPTSQLGPGRVRFHERPPGTAKLLALRGPSTKAVVPNISTIFSIYSDQYDKKMQENMRETKNIKRQHSETSGLHHHLDPLIEASLEDVRVERHVTVKL